MPLKRSAATAFRGASEASSVSESRPVTSRPKPAATSNTSRRPRSKLIRPPAPPSSEDMEDDESEDDEDSNAEADSDDASSQAEENDDDDDDEDEHDSDEEDVSSPAPPVRQTTKPKAAPAKTSVPSRPRPRSPTADAESDPLPPVLPEKLLTALVYSRFQAAETKIGREARGLLGRYVETFIREAVARAVVERKGASGVKGGGGGDFLEVEDLEKLAPQLILDF